MHLTAFMLGLGSFAVASAAKATPDKLVEKMPNFNEESSGLEKYEAKV